MAIYKNEVGPSDKSQIYVWSETQGAPSKKKAVISAHGGTVSMNGMATTSANCELYYYSEHGYMLNDPNIEWVIAGTVKWRQQIHSHLSHDYELTKYTNSKDKPKHNAHGETYAMLNGMDLRFQKAHQTASDYVDLLGTIENKGDEMIGQARQQAALKAHYANLNMDIITIRERKWMKPLYLSQVLNELWKRNYRYDEIHCAFCRGGTNSQSAVSIDFRKSVPSYE